MPVKPHAHPFCYICAHTGSKDNPVKRSDHVPPKNLTPVGDRGDDMLTVDICAKCHNKALSLLDEAFYMWASMSVNVSTPGQKIQEKTLQTLGQKPKILSNIRRSHHIFKPVSIDGNQVIMPMVTQYVSRVHPYIRRLTKGLLYTLYPDYDYFSDHFSIKFFQLINDGTAAYINGYIRNLPEYKRNNDVFKCWHSVGKESGLWVFCFYNTMFFVCRHGKAEHYKQTFPGPYEEDAGLPQEL